ncbi:divergent polysaccharide deacetylase family protein [Devosia rhodophyticola]|uniref:Divergent polysaccharide deacetylase family protein n=1 Tax=Devosia rhodophyticola TaxID=3026423 RepID=A0ABY7YTT9_9HYPH|nr:divergent polysaccharide deacetylase family protein [Devosia rhodophyticola]WDR04724.1 divergent polysaccharide deacetylase family protein [Devosia rhodophyticola]
MAKRHFPLGRILIGMVLLLGLAFAMRLVLVDDPDGGRPVAEASVSATREGSAVASTLAERPIDGPITITADPQQFPAQQVQAAAEQARTGVLPDLSEETKDGPIPRKSATGVTPFAAYAAPYDTAAATGKPKIAIIVSGLGINESGTMDAIEALPPGTTLAFAPYGKALKSTVSAAQNSGHEIFLEIPLEPFDYPTNDPGPQTLLTGESPRANLDKLFWLMARFGGYVGVINNMGARFTASGGDFSPVMEELGTRGLGYLDDGSSNRSIAPQLAASNKVPFARADMLIDDNPAREPIEAALTALETKAKQSGSAIGIISALPISIRTVSEWSRDLANKGFVLVPASALMQ